MNITKDSPTSHKSSDLTGLRFGHYTVISYAGKNAKGTHWLCRCDCGNEKTVRADILKSSRFPSCNQGQCRKGGAVRKHPQRYNEPTMLTWRSMMSRCYNPNSSRYESHGNRGITVCDRWHDFNNFLSDMGERPSRNYSLDRINNDGNYTPENCRWATPKQQSRNTRRNRKITIDGQTFCVAEWSEISGIKQDTILARLKSGWNTQDAVFAPLVKTRSVSAE